MKTFAVILYAVAAALGAFGYWGEYTKAGRLKYDEMAGMIPFFAQIVAAIALLTAIVLSLVIFFKKKIKGDL